MTKHKILAVLTSAALASGAGMGIAQAQTDAGTGYEGTPTTTTTKGKPGKKGPRRMSSAQITALAEKLGVSTADLKTALAAVKPAKPAAGTKPAKGGRGPGMAADLATALGVETSAVQEILDANRPAKPAAGEKPAAGSKPAKPDHTKLVAALASGLNIDEATVTAAFAKLDAARGAEFAAALAAELGLSTEAVQAALDATRPAQRSTTSK